MLKAMTVTVLLCSAVFMVPGRSASVLLTSLKGTKKQAVQHVGDVESECLAVLEGLVVLLRAGTPSVQALRTATADFRSARSDTSSGWGRLVQTADGGGDVPAVWSSLGKEWRCSTFDDVCGAWLMSSRYGCPLAEAMASAASGIRAIRRHRAVVGSAMAGANATITVLVGLPLLGVALGAVLGADVLGTYSGASGFITLWPGLALMWVGRRWAKSLMSKALIGSDLLRPR